MKPRLLLVAGLSLTVPFLACDPPKSVNVRDVTYEVVQLNDEVFRIDIDNPNHTRVGARFNVRTYRYRGVPPEQETVHIYAGPRNFASHNVRTGGCGPPPESASGTGGSAVEGTGEGTGVAGAPVCNLRVTATLMETYYLGQE